MSLLSDIVNNKINIKNNNYDDEEEKKRAQTRLLQDVVNNRVNIQQEDGYISNELASRLSGLNNPSARSLGAVNMSMGSSLSSALTKQYRAEDKMNSARLKYENYKKSINDDGNYYDLSKKRVQLSPSKQDKKSKELLKEYKQAENDYYLAKSEAGAEQVKKNLDNMNPVLRTVEKIANPVVSGIYDLTSTLSKVKVKDENGNIKYVDPLGVETAQEVFKGESGSAYQFYSDLGSGATKIIASSFLPAGQLLYRGDNYIDSYRDAKEKGNSDEQSHLYATISTLSEMAIDELLGGISSRIWKTDPSIEKPFEEVLSKGWNKLLKKEGLSNLLGGMTAEGISESLEEIVDNISGFWVLNQDEPKNFDTFVNHMGEAIPDVVYAGLLGAATSGVVDLVRNPNYKITTETREKIKNILSKKQDIDATIETVSNVNPTTPEMAEAKENMLNKLDDIRDSIDVLDEYEQQNIFEIDKEINETTESLKNVSDEDLKTLKSKLPDTSLVDKEIERRQNVQIENSYNKNKEANKGTTLAEYKKADEVMRFNSNEKKTPKQVVDDGTYTLKQNGTYVAGDNSKFVSDSVSLVSPFDNPKTVKTNSTQDIKVPSAKAVEDLQNTSTVDELFNKLSKLSERVENTSIKHENKITLKKFMNMTKDNKKLNDSIVKLYEEHVNKDNYDPQTAKELAFKIVELDPEKAYSLYITNAKKGDNSNSTLHLGVEYLHKMLKSGDIDEIKIATITDTLDEIATTGTEASRNMNIMKQLYRDDPLGCFLIVNKTLKKAYQQDSKKHKNQNETWVKQNDPTKLENNSPYRLSEKNTEKLYDLSQDVYETMDKYGENSKEALEKKCKLINFTMEITPNSFSNAVKSLWYSGMLSSSRIWINNGTSNAIMVPFNVLNTVVSNIVEVPFKKETGIKTSANLGVKNSVTSITQGFSTGMSKLVNDFKYDLTNVNSKYNESVKLSESNKFIDEFKASVENRKYTGKTKTTKKIASRIDLYNKSSNFVMGSGDAPYREAYYASKLNSLKYNEATRMSKKANVNVIYSIVEKNSGNIEIKYKTPEGNNVFQSINIKNADMTLEDVLTKNNMKIVNVTDTMIDIASQYADERIYVSDNKVQRGLNKVRSGLNDVVPLKIGDIGFGDMVLKFTKVPSNVVRTLYRSTLISTGIDFKNNMKNYKEALQSGSVDKIMKSQDKFVKSIADGVSGTVIMATLYYIANALKDNITGYMDSNKENDYLKKALGEKEYSIKIGDKYFSFDYGNLASMMLSMTTDISKSVNEQKDISSILNEIQNPISELILEQTFASNIQDFFSNNYNSGLGETLAKQLLSVPSQFIPGILKDFSVAADNFTSRDVYTGNVLEQAWNQIREKIPGLRQQLDVKYDNWGDIKKVGGDGITNFFNTFIKTSGSSLSKANETSDELLNIYHNTRNSSVIPHELTSYFSYNSTKYDLEGETYNTYNSQYIKTYYEKLNKLFETTEYKNSDDENKASLISEVYNYAHEEVKKDYLKSLDIDYSPPDKYVIKSNATRAKEINGVIENNMSLENSSAMVSDKNKFAYSQMFFKNYSTYSDVTTTMADIAAQYTSSNDKKQAVINYVNTLSLSRVQKMILIRERYSSLYKNNEKEISDYLKKNTKSQEEYEYAMKKLKYIK